MTRKKHLVKTMSTSPELEELRIRKAELAEESRALEQKQKTLTERTEVLEEKLAIRELENNNQNRRESIKQLESKIDELDRHLTSATTKSEPSAPTNEQPTEANEPAQEETIETDVAVMPLEEPQTVEEAENLAEEMKRHQEKKKRRLF
jgi:hypothetical protein